VAPAALLLLATLVAYAPALAAGFVWDDDHYVTQNPLLRDLAGLARIWLEPTATPQYYPLVHTTFWLEWHAWGQAPAGYHAVNVLLHALTAILLARVLVRLGVRGAWIAAALFALHPIEVESVAWVSERKNVLSGALCLGSALAWLRREEAATRRGRARAYATALALFLAALLAKTVTCSLPAALLVVQWWRKGRLRAADVVPLVPFFALGVAAGLGTAWLEAHHVGARGAEWSLGLAERGLIAGRALWFYAAKLAWPAGLTFVYPRWEIDAASVAQWAFPAAAVLVVVALWLARHRLGRAPVAAALLFTGTLAPALGFVDVYPMRYTFAADHYQYLAGIALLVPAAVALARAPRPVAAGLLALLAALTFARASAFRDAETLWRDTLAKNPGCWMAHNNLGALLAARGETQAAIVHYRESYLLYPHDAVSSYDWGVALGLEGKLDEAADRYREALRIDPEHRAAHKNLGSVHARKGRAAEAIASYLEAERLFAGDAELENDLGALLMARGEHEQAKARFAAAARLAPSFGKAHANLGMARLATGDAAGAVASLERALQLDGPDAQVQQALARARERLRRLGPKEPGK
jgi:Flp pilus assembly protein TadD